MRSKNSVAKISSLVAAINPGFTMTVSLGSVAVDVEYGDTSSNLSFDDVYDYSGGNLKLLGEAIPSSIYQDDSIITDLQSLIEIKGGSIPTGGCIIAGGPDKGKTPAIQAIASEVKQAYGDDSVVYIRFGEPLPGYVSDPIELLQRVALAMADPGVRLIAIDSLKDVMGQMKGQLMARGIPRLFFVVFSQWSAIAASLGKTIITPLNVSTDSEEAIAEVETACLSNSTCTFTVESSIMNKIVYSGIARTGDGKPRSKITLVVRFDAKGQPSLSLDDTIAHEVQPSSEQSSLTINLPQRSSISKALMRHIKVGATNQSEDQE